MNFYMLLLPISCMGSELLDPYLSVRPSTVTKLLATSFLMVILELECNILLK